MYNIVTVVLEKKKKLKKRLLYTLCFVLEQYYELPATLRLKNPNHIITSRNGHVSNTVGFRNDETFGTRLRVCTTTSRANAAGLRLRTRKVSTTVGTRSFSQDYSILVDSC